jgi:hypothetical protein
MLFQVALGPLHVDVLAGGKLRGDAIIRSGKGLGVLAAPGCISPFQILAD